MGKHKIINQFIKRVNKWLNGGFHQWRIVESHTHLMNIFQEVHQCVHDLTHFFINTPVYNSNSNNLPIISDDNGVTIFKQNHLLVALWLWFLRLTFVYGIGVHDNWEVNWKPQIAQSTILIDGQNNRWYTFQLWYRHLNFIRLKSSRCTQTNLMKNWKSKTI